MTKVKCKYAGSLAITGEYTSFGKPVTVCFGWHGLGETDKSCRKCESYIGNNNPPLSPTGAQGEDE